MSARPAHMQSAAVITGFISSTYTNLVSKVSFISKTPFCRGVNSRSFRDFTEISVKTDSISSEKSALENQPRELKVNCPAPSSAPLTADG